MGKGFPDDEKITSKGGRFEVLVLVLSASFDAQLRAGELKKGEGLVGFYQENVGGKDDLFEGKSWEIVIMILGWPKKCSELMIGLCMIKKH